MWRALSVARGELIAYLDSDTRALLRRTSRRACSARCCSEPGVRFVKGTFRRPFATAGGEELPADGGRVTELTARPLLSAFYPELAGFAQPLAGEVAARRELFHRLPFATGYAVETAMLLDAHELLGGTDGMAAGGPGRAPQPPPAAGRAGPMAYAVLRRGGRPAAGATTPSALLDAEAARAGEPTAARSRACPSPPSVAVRCVYTDLDGTLLGRGASLFRDCGGRIHAARRRARSRPATARGGGGHQVRPPPRAGDGGRAPARAELLHLRGGLAAW